MRPRIFGPITIEIQANQTPLGINQVEFYIDGNFLGRVTKPPYDYTLRGALKPRFEEHCILVWAYDNGGKREMAQIFVYKFF
jgi:hypothetical protein